MTLVDEIPAVRYLTQMLSYIFNFFSSLPCAPVSYPQLKAQTEIGKLSLKILKLTNFDNCKIQTTWKLFRLH